MISDCQPSFQPPSHDPPKKGGSSLISRSRNAILPYLSPGHLNETLIPWQTHQTIQITRRARAGVACWRAFSLFAWLVGLAAIVPVLDTGRHRGQHAGLVGTDMGACTCFRGGYAVGCVVGVAVRDVVRLHG